jgi:hypothetical protein
MGGKEEEGVSFKLIQKLTGKLTQKMREFENEKGMTSENIKYVINMVLSAIDLGNLSEEDKEDIMSKFEGEEDMSDMDMGDMDMGDEEGGGMEDMGSEEGGEMTGMSGEESESYGSRHGSILDSIFGESKVDKVISKYFHITKEEKTRLQESKKEKQLINKSITKQKMKEVRKFTETIEQEFSSEKFLQENSNFIFVGKTNKNNLVFENKDKQIKISPEGSIL